MEIENELYIFLEPIKFCVLNECVLVCVWALNCKLVTVW